MNKMLQGLNNSTNFAMTENGAVARASTNSEVLDFFSMGGAMRGNEKAAVTLFDNAWNENPEMALKAMFYFRDVRGGQGQREAFRQQLKYLTGLSPESVLNVIQYVPEYGRWDDLYVLFGTELESDVLMLMYSQFKKDLRDMVANNKISLLGKWLKSENASSPKTKRLAKTTRKFFGLDSKTYRKHLTALRRHLKVVEAQLTKNNWKDVEYSAVPSKAMMKYRKAFYRHDENRFAEFIAKAAKGEVKINSSALYPYEIVQKIREISIQPNLAQAQWTQLPDYVQGSEENSIAVVDVSGSMHGTPMDVSVSIGLYLAERASGPFADHFITFSESPNLVRVQGTDVSSRVRNMMSADWGYNTNIEAVFDLILSTAINQGIRQDEMIDKLYIISDMEFDSACSAGFGNSRFGRSRAIPKTLMQSISDKFVHAGYEMPKLVFWNVDARNAQVPMSLDDRGFQNVSGFSPSIFASLMSGEFVGAYELMVQVLMSERYADIQVA